MIPCSRCNRPLLNPLYAGGMAFGSTCYRKVAGAKPTRRQRAEQPVDVQQADLFAEDLQYARRVDVLLSGISLEMPR